MVVKKSVIETGVDKLVALVNERKRISVKDAAKELGVSVASVEDWADFLEEEGIISIETQLATVYLVERRLGKKELIEKLEQVKGEKEDFCRRVESSVNVLQRDIEETKRIDVEFSKIRTMLEDNFSKLSKKLQKLEDFKMSHREIEEKHTELESDYSKKIRALEGQLSEDQKKYHDIMSSIENEMTELKKEQEMICSMKASEKQLESKVAEINHFINQVKTEIDKSNRQLAVDEERIKRSSEIAKKIKEDIAANSKELDQVSLQLAASHKELGRMESEFMKDLEKMGSGDLEKIGPYKEGKELVDKVKTFFSQTKEVDDLIKKAEVEETELKNEYEKLTRKVAAFTAVTSVPDINKEMSELSAELQAIETKKSMLGAHLKKLRNVMRSLVT